MRVRRGLSIAVLAILFSAAVPSRNAMQASGPLFGRQMSFVDRQEPRGSMVHRVLVWILDELGVPKPG